MNDFVYVNTGMGDFAYANTDKEIWREVEGDYYAPSIHVTSSGKIGINVGGTVHTKDVRDWHNLAEEDWKSEEVTVDSTQASEQVSASVDESQASPAVVNMFAALSRKIVSLESQLRDTQRNVERQAEELENAKHRISKHATMFAAVEERVGSLADGLHYVHKLAESNAERLDATEPKEESEFNQLVEAWRLYFENERGGSR